MANMTPIRPPTIASLDLPRTGDGGAGKKSGLDKSLSSGLTVLVDPIAFFEGDALPLSCSGASVAASKARGLRYSPERKGPRSNARIIPATSRRRSTQYNLLNLPEVFYFNRHADVACHLSSAAFARLAPVQNSPNTFVAMKCSVICSGNGRKRRRQCRSGQREERQSARAPATLILCCSFIIVKQRNLVGLVLIKTCLKKGLVILA